MVRFSIFSKNKNVVEEDFKVTELPQKTFNGLPTDEKVIDESVKQAKEVLNTFKPSTEPKILNIVHPIDDTNYNESDVEEDALVTNRSYVEEEVLYSNAEDEFRGNVSSYTKLKPEDEVLELLERIESEEDEEDELIIRQIENEIKQVKARTSVSIVYDENESVKRRTFHLNEERVEFEAKYYLEVDTYGYFTGKDERGATIQINPSKCYTVEIKG